MSLLYEQRQKESSFDDLGRQSVGQNVGHQQNEESRSPRKYLVLLHDCLAIKFVPLVSTFPLAFNNSNNRVHGSNNQTLNYNMDHQRLSSSSQSKSNAGLSSSSTMSTLFNNEPSSNSSEVDHSLHGLYLYKGFREANLKCYWNSALHEAFRNLEYRGHIASVVLVWAIPRFFTTLRTAWSRQMLRSPPGFRIEFIGEIEELIADPIRQSQFAPLSDSLCWAILEITSMGQEAFVDSILQALNAAFPKMVQPNREIVYSTLEKLTRERKVYQTSQGYFVVTPDTFRYMVSSNSQPPSDLYYNPDMLTLDALINSHHSSDPEKESHHSWDSTASAENSTCQRTSRNLGECEPDGSREPGLRRHNSLKIIRQKDSIVPSKGLGPRSMSFRLYKSKSVHNTAEESGTQTSDAIPIDKLSKQMQTLLKPDEPSRRNSLSKTALAKIRKLFRKSNSSSKQAANNAKRSGEVSVSKSSASTQTPTCQVLKPKPSQQLSPDRIIKARPNVVDTEKNSSLGHFTLPFDCNNELPNSKPCWNSLPIRQQERPNSRQSVRDEHGCHLYSVPTSPDNFPGMSNRPQTLVGFPFNRGESSRCSTLSQGTSLGYGSQGQCTSLQGFTSQSPSPSSRPMSPNNNSAYPNSGKASMVSPQNLLAGRNYKNYYDHYRRRYPTYTYAGPNTKPISHYEIVRTKTPEATNQKIIESKKISHQNIGEQILSTTTTVNSTTNMELEFSLPLGRMTSKKMQSQSTPDGKVVGNAANGTSTNGSMKAQIFVGNPKNAAEVKTTVSRNGNGTIETHFDCDSGDDGRSRVQIKVTDPKKTDVVLVNKKTGAEKHLNEELKLHGFGNELNSKFLTAQA